jgi:arsenate reductase-like glutaredoxin family protein
LQRAGLRPSEVLSTRSRVFRELGLAGRQLSEDEVLDLMVREPTLLRRPLIIGPTGALVGFNQKQLEALTQADKSGN